MGFRSPGAKGIESGVVERVVVSKRMKKRTWRGRRGRNII